MSFLVTLLPVFGNLALGALSIASGYALKLLSRHIASKEAQEVLHRTSELAMVAVKEVYQSYVGPIKKAGTFTPAAKEKARTEAMVKVRSFLGHDGLKALVHAVGGGKSPQEFIASAVEAAVHDRKIAAATAAPAGWRPDVTLPQPELSLEQRAKA